MKLRAGYKQTDIGVIPQDWLVNWASDLNPFVTSGSRGWAKYYSNRGSLFLRITNLSRDCIYPDLKDQKLVDLPSSETEGLRTALQDGDILISITADIGIIGYVDGRIPKPAYINQHIACLRLPNDKVDSRFQSYSLASSTSQKRFAEITDVGAKSGINLTTIKNLRIVVPPLPEQQAIANALSDVDELIASLDALIAKKRDIKQATMQQLLTGKTRLPGFSGEWETKRLGALLRFQVGFPFKSDYFNEKQQGFRLIKNRDLKNDDQLYWYSGDFDVSYVVRNGDLLIGMDGDFLPCIWSKGEALLNQRVGRIFALDGFHQIFAYYCLIAPMKNIELATAATTVKHLSHSDIENIETPIPTYSEQAAIAEVLSDMDTELVELEQRHDKTIALKQGMMQELLTGRTRLI